MTRSHYELASSATVIEAARTAVGKELWRRLPVAQKPPPEIRELIARLVSLDSVKQRVAERSVVASSLPPTTAARSNAPTQLMESAR